MATSFLKENVRNVDTEQCKCNPCVHVSVNSVELHAAFFYLAYCVHFKIRLHKLDDHVAQKAAHCRRLTSLIPANGMFLAVIL